MARSTLQITGIREARARIDDVGERARRPEPVLRSTRVRLAIQMSERRRFTTYRWKGVSAAWRARKRREGLSPRTMQATQRLKAALENMESGTTRYNVYNGVLTWGLRAGEVGRYAAIQANMGRRAVVIDRPARVEITQRVEDFLANGFIG